MIGKPSHQKAAHVAMGFTLVEIAIVLVVIGLVAGGVLLGRSLIRSSEIQGTIREMSSLTAAYRMFEQRYNCIPGDCTDATSIFGAAVLNGNGNKLVQSTSSGGSVNEHEQLLLQLTLRGDLPKEHNSMNYARKVKLGNCYMNIHCNPAPVYGHLHCRKNVIHLYQPLTASPWAAGCLSGEDAGAIDTVMDDGKPGTGKMLFYNSASWNSQPFGECTTVDPYLGAASRNAEYIKNGRPVCMNEFNIN